MKKLPVVAVDIIVQDSKDKILLGRVAEKWQGGRKYIWGLPGREISFGEDIKTSVKHNLKEELGVEMIDGQVVCVNSNFGLGNHYVTIGVTAKIDGNVVNKRPADWLEWKWFEKKSIPPKLFPSAERTLKAFLKESMSLDFG